MLNEVQPQVVTQNIRIQVSQFFTELKQKLNDIEMDVMQSVKKSKVLHDFLDSSEALSEEINDDIIDMIEEENSLVNEKISQSKFAYLVIKHQYYGNLNSGFEQFNRQAKAEIKRIKALESKIISFKMNRDNTVKKFLTEMIEEILTVDQKKPEMRMPSGFHIQEEELK